MQTKSSTPNKVAFGDFQTPSCLTEQVTRLLGSLGVRPRAILEPTCGTGAFLKAAAISFPEAESIFGVEINHRYVENAKTSISDARIRIFEGDFFKLNWSLILAQSAGPWLILGNPPWITNSKLSAISIPNAPYKRNHKNLSGIDAVTGKSNFDISEWMLLQYLSWLSEGGTFAVLCKMTVARKVLAHAWSRGVPVGMAKVFRIDAMRHFDVAVEACLFCLRIEGQISQMICEVYDDLDSIKPSGTLTYLNGQVVKHASAYRRGQAILGKDRHYQWRSGIKHDCSKVMELRRHGMGYVNGFNEQVDIEATYIYPMYKSSDLLLDTPRDRTMLVPQRYLGEDLSELRLIAPKTWNYLCKHRERFRKRASSIYEGKGDFAIFGVGPYSFTPWKVAISGFYKQSRFKAIGPVNTRASVFDDTVYYIACYSKTEAEFMAELLNSDMTQELLNSLIHWDNKRPITVDLLKQISLEKIASELGRAEEYIRLATSTDPTNFSLKTFGLFGLTQSA